MNRRIFLGLTLAAVATPVLARTTDSTRHVLSFHHQHTNERLTVCYRIGEHYQRSELQKVNHFLRDFRNGDSVPIDPKLLDLLFEVKRDLGNPNGVYQVLSAYRSPHTNAMLRNGSSRVAKRSLHLTGQAIDVRLTDTSTRRIRDCATALGRGGVGYYSRSNFVHLDTGSVRRWNA